MIFKNYQILLIGLLWIEMGWTQELLIQPKEISMQEGSGIPINILNRTPDKIKILGNQYIDESFRDATINNETKVFKLRYNNFSDFFEYEKEPGEIINISKNQNHTISFKDGNNYFFKKYFIRDKEFESYLLLVGNRNSHYKIYKSLKMEFLPYKEANNSYEKDRNPEYKLKKPRYFIEYNNSLKVFETTKDLEKIFTEHSKEIKKFFSQNKINLDSDEIFMIQNFLESILNE